jgi:hypothetical protein
VRTVRDAPDARSFVLLLDRSIRPKVSRIRFARTAGSRTSTRPPEGPGARRMRRIDVHPSGRMTSLRFVIDRLDRLAVDTSRTVCRPNV